jgi:hypothetical protein
MSSVKLYRIFSSQPFARIRSAAQPSAFAQGYGVTGWKGKKSVLQ